MLRKFYLSEGYADFRVVSAVAELTPDRDGFIITFTIEEGERYQFGKIDVDITLKDLPREAVLPLLTVQAGEWYNADMVERSIAVLTDALGNRGYAFVEVKPEITRNRDERTLDIVFHVQEGPQVYVERIDITRQRAHARQGDPPRIPPGRGRRRSTPPAHAALEGTHPRISASSRRSRSPTARARRRTAPSSRSKSRSSRPANCRWASAFPPRTGRLPTFTSASAISSAAARTCASAR